MSDEMEKSESAAGGDAVAMGMAMHRTSPVVDAELVAYLRDQRRHLHEQLKQIHLGIWEKWLGVLLRVATAIVGTAVAGAVGFMVWSAAHSEGLIIEPFSVPPDMASRGLTGQVVAAKLLDRLTLMQSQTNSARPAKSYSNAWGEHGIKLEIPETGISLNELDSWLRDRLGHDTHLSGEVVRTATGLALSARASDQGVPGASGPETDIDSLVQRLAEQVYRATQPFRYGMFLVTNDRGEEALPLFEDLTRNGDKEDRLWGHIRWVVGVVARDGSDAGIRLLKQWIAADPKELGAYENLGGFLNGKSRMEEALQVAQTQRDLVGKRQSYVPSARIPTFRKMTQARIDAFLGAYHEAAPVWVDVLQSGYPGLSIFNLMGPLIDARIGEHDLAPARALMADYAEAGRSRRGFIMPLRWQLQMANDLRDWAGVRAQEAVFADWLRRSPTNRQLFPTGSLPVLAYAQARLGQTAAAQARIAATPEDCDICLINRARIAALSGQHARADAWFSRAEAHAPSLPFADTFWGETLLERGQPDAAIEKFKLANQKGPHFADALEGWGEALMAKNQSHLALEKFAESEKYAPNWGHLHFKWGEALVYAGKKDEAAKQFARAAQLDLTPSEKSELARHR